jgi:hypothetical protein
MAARPETEHTIHTLTAGQHIPYLDFPHRYYATACGNWLPEWKTAEAVKESEQIRIGECCETGHTRHTHVHDREEDAVEAAHHHLDANSGETHLKEEASNPIDKLLKDNIDATAERSAPAATGVRP